MGSVIAGDDAFIEKAIRVRKRLGGWMRQAGLVAAAARVALATGVERLSLDHALAKELAERLGGLEGFIADPAAVETNIAMVDLDPDGPNAAEVSTRFGEHGVRVMAMGERRLRFVTHSGVGPSDVDRVTEAASAVLAAR